MLTSTSSPSHSAANAAVVIRERIKEKRLYEARFLFGLLDDDDMPRQERLALERELEGLLAVVRELRDEADRYQAAGETAPARRMRREMECIAVDVPDPTRQNGVRSVAAGRLLREAEPAGPATERASSRRHKARRNHRKLPLDVRFSQWLDKRRGRRAVAAAAARVAATETQPAAASGPAPASKRRRGRVGFPADRAVALSLCVLAVAWGLFLLARQDPSASPVADAPKPTSSITIGALSVEDEGSGGQQSLGAQTDTDGRVFP